MEKTLDSLDQRVYVKCTLARKKLDEINFLRPLVVFLIVVLHSFTMYTGGWPLPEGIERNYIYMAIAKLSHSCILETFTLMSGYLWAYSCVEQGKKVGFFSLVTKKFHRLIIPSFVFGILYQGLVEGIAPSFSLTYWSPVIQGIAHLWFLPMLFWCFVLTFFLHQWKVVSSVKLFCLVLVCIAPLENLSLQLGQTAYYWLFFYIGWLFRIHHAALKRQARPGRLVKFALLFLTAFAGYTVFREFLMDTQLGLFAGDWVRQMWIHASRMVAAVLGVYVLLLLSFWVTERYSLPAWWIKLNAYCFGIYLLHHFILPLLYYHTALPLYLGSYLLPWLGLLVSLVLSFCLSYLLKKTAIGRWLI